MGEGGSFNKWKPKCKWKQRNSSVQDDFLAGVLLLFVAVDSQRLVLYSPCKPQELYNASLCNIKYRFLQGHCGGHGSNKWHIWIQGRSQSCIHYYKSCSVVHEAKKVALWSLCANS